MLGSVAAQRAVFAVMTSGFDAGKAAGFEGSIVYDLGLGDGTRRAWTIRVKAWGERMTTVAAASWGPRTVPS